MAIVDFDTASSPSVTFLLCAESGYFEAQTLLAIECVRKFGGSLANAPVLVVTPRFGPSLARATLDAFERLNVNYVYRNMRSKHDWYPYMNKGLAARLAEEMASTDQIIWLDSDVLLISEPFELLLQQDEDFACCAVDKNVGTSGVGDPNEPYWQALADHYGIAIDQLRWVRAEHDAVLVRMRLHSGVYSFRRSAGLGKAFVDDMESMLGSGIAYSRRIPHPGDDVALAFSVVKLGLRWRPLSMACIFEMTPTSEIYRRESARLAHVLHFHHTLASIEGCKWFLGELELFRPDVADWLRARVPLSKRQGGFAGMVVRRAIRQLRERRQARQIKSCRFMVP